MPTQIAVNLTADGVATKARKTQGGQIRNGTQIDKKHQFKLLRHSIFLGDISHWAKWFPGIYAAIIDQNLLNIVHEVLAKDGHSQSVETKIRSHTDALLRDLLYVPSGERMYPTYSHKSGRKYHYYVSKSVSRFGAPGKNLRAPDLERDNHAVHKGS